MVNLEYIIWTLMEEFTKTHLQRSEIRYAMKKADQLLSREKHADGDGQSKGQE